MYAIKLNQLLSLLTLDSLVQKTVIPDPPIHSLPHDVDVKPHHLMHIKQN